ncbi:hypothetical protein MLD38_012376 [Melastoma candidum]|uniref:Uncharacterized protein n=1 Tax=Melastoma candidum TaxID=119954 RepID=A0ACB9R7E6_9MYRT|nr:hypothetical protein MLD38_012376 [Melastoma candidum]
MMRLPSTACGKVFGRTKRTRALPVCALARRRRWNSVTVNTGLNWEKLPAEVVELLTAGPSTRKHHPGGAAADPRAPLPLEQPVVENREAHSWEDGQ